MVSERNPQVLLLPDVEVSGRREGAPVPRDRCC